MGKLTIAETEALQEAGVLSTEAVKEMQDKGLVSTRRRSSRRYMKTSNGNLVSPQLYFQGIGTDEYSEEMSELKEKFNTLVTKYTTINTPTKS
jgi:hypothetical protein|tara:strand:+ start:2313 stop:2591 length:279 start_codon:yes stop_codon:yes gene_type:complete